MHGLLGRKGEEPGAAPRGVELSSRSTPTFSLPRSPHTFQFNNNLMNGCIACAGMLFSEPGKVSEWTPSLRPQYASLTSQRAFNRLMIHCCPSPADASALLPPPTTTTTTTTPPSPPPFRTIATTTTTIATTTTTTTTPWRRSRV